MSNFGYKPEKVVLRLHQHPYGWSLGSPIYPTASPLPGGLDWIDSSIDSIRGFPALPIGVTVEPISPAALIEGDALHAVTAPDQAGEKRR